MSAEFLKERLAALSPRSDLAPKPTTDPEDDTDLPDTGAPYQAHGRAANKAVYTLHCALGKDGYRSFQYVHLDSDSAFKIEPGGHVIVVRFGGVRATQVTVRGRNLWKLYDYLHEHRLPWIMRADRDFSDSAGKQPLITTIEFAEVSEKVRG